MGELAPLPSQMIAFQQVGYSMRAPEAVRQAIDVRVPATLAPGELLLEVHASGMNSGDVFMGRGGQRAVFELSFPCTIGRDVAGIVRRVGPCANTADTTAAAAPATAGAAASGSGFREGDRVVGYVEVGGGRGTFAQYVVVQAAHCVRVPDSVPLLHAACLPASGCTTYGALMKPGVLLPSGAGKKILILGGSSATGMVAIQLARAAGCSDIAVTSSAGVVCSAVGATRVINHRDPAAQPWEQQLAGANYDIVFDTAEGLPAWNKARRVLKPRGGKFVSLVMQDGGRAGDPPPTIGSMLSFLCRVISRWFWSWFGYPHFIWHINPGRTDGLSALVGMLAEGKLRAVLDPASPAPPTMEGFTRLWDAQMSGRAHGKLIMDWKQKNQ